MTTLTNGTDTITLDQVNGFRSARQPYTIKHRILGRPDPDVTFATAALRTGTLELLIEDEAASLAAEELLATPGIWTHDDDDRPSIHMSFVVADDGTIERELEDGTRSAWLVRFPFSEVLP